jgi:hypothetical protein
MFLIIVYNSPIIKVNLLEKHFCHAKISQTMTPLSFLSYHWIINE